MKRQQSLPVLHPSPSRRSPWRCPTAEQRRCSLGAPLRSRRRPRLRRFMSLSPTTVSRRRSNVPCRRRPVRPPLRLPVRRLRDQPFVFLPPASRLPRRREYLRLRLRNRSRLPCAAPHLATSSRNQPQRATHSTSRSISTTASTNSIPKSACRWCRSYRATQHPHNDRLRPRRGALHRRPCRHPLRGTHHHPQHPAAHLACALRSCRRHRLPRRPCTLRRRCSATFQHAHLHRRRFLILLHRWRHSLRLLVRCQSLRRCHSLKRRSRVNAGPHN